MSVRAQQPWFRRAVFAGAVLATSALAIGVTPRPAAAQYAYNYGNPYHRDGGWGSDHRGWHRGWSKNVRGHGDGGRGDHRAGRSNEGFSGSSGGGRGGGGGKHGSGAGRDGDGFVGAVWATRRPPRT